jgi:hypothetical protein
MTKDINLQVPDSLHERLLTEAKEQGVSLEALCLSLLEMSPKRESSTLVEPSMYPYLANGELRSEILKVLQSDLSKEEVKRRVHRLKTQIVRCIR